MEAFWSVSTFTVVFLGYHFLTNSNVKENNPDTDPGMPPNTSRVLYQRLLGVLLFGLIPLIVLVLMFRFPIQAYGINFLNFSSTLFWVGVITPIILLLNYINAPKPSNLAMYPQIRSKNWGNHLLFVSSLSWISYLLAYEFMFRGFLLFSFYHAWGSELAIAVNTSLYALAHLPKGMKETLGAIPLGIVLCILTLSTGNIWAAVLIHIIMALSNEWMSIYRHPQMTFTGKS